MRNSLAGTLCSSSILLMLFLTNAPQPAQSRPFWQMVPSMTQLLRQITSATLDTMNNVLDESLKATLVDTGITEHVVSGLDMKDPDAKRNVSQVIVSRGFKAEEYDVITRDGYILTIQRIINPLVSEADRIKMKPVIMQHGLMSSSIDWVINSVNVRPAHWPKQSDDSSSSSSNESTTEPQQLVGDSQEHPNSLGFYMANEGYDVFLANSRGNIYGQRHVKLTSWQPKFWDFTFDEQIKYDLPDIIKFVQTLTNKTKVGYVGHSQGTVMMFGLLSDRPEYADVVEPFIALAPVAYCNHSKSPVKYFAIYTPVFQNINWWFATSNALVRYLAPIVCGPKVVRRDICANIFFLSVGFDLDELDESRIYAYLNHMPSGTSIKNIAHYGQEIISRRFAHFDHGIIGNQIRYGQSKAPEYKLENIRSKSIALFTAENDWLASPKDVARLKADLKVEPFAVVNMTEAKPKWNHIDFVYGKNAGRLVNSRVLEIFDHFRTESER